MAEEQPRQHPHGPEAPTATTPGDPARQFAGLIDSIESAQTLVGERYRLERLAGAGGMGRVFAASDRVLGRRVAIKLLHAAGRDEASRRLVITEARAMAGLRHPNVCRVHEVVLDAATPFIVMDWITGSDLRSHTRPIDLRARLAVFTKVVDAVSSLHAAGLVHGDLKPTNVLVDERGEPVIVDFGLAASHEEGDDRTSPGGGTPGYAAPERWAHGRPAPNSDVYSLGVMLFELLTGRPPFRGATAEEVRRMAETEHPPLPQEIAPETPEAIQRICLVALERDAARRYPDASQMHADLRRFLAGESVAARPSFLMSRFTEQVQQQIDRVNEWMRLGLVTQREAESLTDRLCTIQQPESPWIIDSRRLTLSQVALYLGGWLVVLGLSVGLWYTWESLSSWQRLAVPWVATIALGGAGIVLDRAGQRRVALGYLVTATLTLPVAAWVLLRETGLLGAVMEDRELFGVAGLMNRQLLTIALAWLAVTLASRLLTGASAFVLFAVIAAAAGWNALWLSLGRFTDEDRLTVAEISLWTAAFGAALCPIGLRINRREEETARRLGPARLRQRDAWPVLTAGIALLTLGLAGAAWHAPERYFLRPVDLEAWFTPVGWQSLAFAVNGVILQGLAMVLEHRRTPLRARLANLLRWIIPSHFLGALLALEIDDSFDLWPLWLTLLPIASVAVVLLSVPRQWKPFLVTGLAYLAVWYVRAFIRADAHLENPTGAWTALTFSLLGAGAVTMVVAWRAPQRRAGRNPARPIPAAGAGVVRDAERGSPPPVPPTPAS